MFEKLIERLMPQKRVVFEKPVTLDLEQDRHIVQMTIGVMRVECKEIETALDSWKDHSPKQLSEMCSKYERMKDVLKMWDERFPN